MRRAHGLTHGVREFADQLRAAGHRVTLPDLYDGATFDNLDDGVGHAEQVSFDTISSASLPAYGEGAATLLKRRVLSFLADIA